MFIPSRPSLDRIGLAVAGAADRVRCGEEARLAARPQLVVLGVALDANAQTRYGLSSPEGEGAFNVSCFFLKKIIV